ncbi:MAG: hypothetical protein K0M45_04005 [Candidatus Paracaedibacteraceae bacterium]|nr:hypothetical protein [Candidatus Paracaedibacteraceae bacterium]
MESLYKKWFEYLENPLAYTSYYKEPEDKLLVNIEKIKIEWEETRIIIRGTLIKFPDTPPDRWAFHNHDAATIELALTSFNTVKIEDNLKRNKAGAGIDEKRLGKYLGYPEVLNITEIMVSRLNDEHLLIKASGEGCSFEITCFFLRVNSIKGYNKEQAVKAYW